MVTLLHDTRSNPTVMEWVNSTEGIFKINNTSEFAKFRGKQRNGGEFMEFKHVNRNIRYHTHPKEKGKGTGKLYSLPGQRLTYQFTEEMENIWQTEEPIISSTPLPPYRRHAFSDKESVASTSVDKT